jgi:hypothetical protein
MVDELGAREGKRMQQVLRIDARPPAGEGTGPGWPSFPESPVDSEDDSA